MMSVMLRHGSPRNGFASLWTNSDLTKQSVFVIAGVHCIIASSESKLFPFTCHAKCLLPGIMLTWPMTSLVVVLRGGEQATIVLFSSLIAGSNRSLGRLVAWVDEFPHFAECIREYIQCDKHRVDRQGIQWFATAMQHCHTPVGGFDMFSFAEKCANLDLDRLTKEMEQDVDRTGA